MTRSYKTAASALKHRILTSFQKRTHFTPQEMATHLNVHESEVFRIMNQQYALGFLDRQCREDGECVYSPNPTDFPRLFEDVNG